MLLLLRYIANIGVYGEERPQEKFTDNNYYLIPNNLLLLIRI